MMMSAESKCRKLYRGDYEFSPNVRHWIERERVLRALIRCKQNRAGNLGNIKRAARRNGIKDPFLISAGELVEMMGKCKKKCKELLAE